MCGCVFQDNAEAHQGLGALFTETNTPSSLIEQTALSLTLLGDNQAGQMHEMCRTETQ
jgi:hypothetical protein